MFKGFLGGRAVLTGLAEEHLSLQDWELFPRGARGSGELWFELGMVGIMTAIASCECQLESSKEFSKNHCSSSLELDESEY